MQVCTDRVSRRATGHPGGSSRATCSAGATQSTVTTAKPDRHTAVLLHSHRNQRNNSCNDDACRDMTSQGMTGTSDERLKQSAIPCVPAVNCDELHACRRCVSGHNTCLSSRREAGTTTPRNKTRRGEERAAQHWMMRDANLEAVCRRGITKKHCKITLEMRCSAAAEKATRVPAASVYTNHVLLLLLLRTKHSTIKTAAQCKQRFTQLCTA